MNIHFQLRAQGKRNPIIMVQVFDSRFKGRKFKFSTGISVDPSIWDKRKGRIKHSSNIDLAMLTNVNQRLDSIEKLVLSFISEKHGQSTLSSDELRETLRQGTSFEPPQKRKEETFNIWQTIIETTRNKQGEKISAGTRRSKEQTKRLVEQYSLKAKRPITFTTMDMDFYRGFEFFMETRGISRNTIGRHFKEIKAILREAHDRDIPVNPAFQKKSFKSVRIDAENTYLTDAEIKKIYGLALSPALTIKRDIFVMACYLGLRHSDWPQIDQSNIIMEGSVELLKITQRKTKDPIHIPLHTAVKSILAKYQGRLPKIISNQKFNDALKQIAKKAELGNISINGTLEEKWKYISTHTARRSFATNAYLSKAMDVYQIMKCTGHKTESSFLKYLKLNGRDFAVQAAESKFFNDQSWNSSKLKIAS